MAAEMYQYIGEVKIPMTGGWVKVPIMAPDTYTATKMLESMYGAGNVAAVQRD